MSAIGYWHSADRRIFQPEPKNPPQDTNYVCVSSTTTDQIPWKFSPQSTATVSSVFLYWYKVCLWVVTRSFLVGKCKYMTVLSRCVILYSPPSYHQRNVVASRARPDSLKNQKKVKNIRFGTTIPTEQSTKPCFSRLFLICQSGIVAGRPNVVSQL